MLEKNYIRSKLIKTSPGISALRLELQRVEFTVALQQTDSEHENSHVASLEWYSNYLSATVLFYS
jgi:hypothetical protein